jgi:diadenosine tetraphosphate (Ap4A) HIT family hydrolase
MPLFALHPHIESDSIFVRDLALSQLRLQNQKQAPWLLLVPRRAGVMAMDELTAEDRAVLIEEIVAASRALRVLYAPDRINVASLGNIVPQLHIHIIARFAGDAAWPGPVWGQLQPALYDLQALTTLKAKLNDEALWKA